MDCLDVEVAVGLLSSGLGEFLLIVLVGRRHQCQPTRLCILVYRIIICSSYVKLVDLYGYKYFPVICLSITYVDIVWVVEVVLLCVVSQQIQAF